MRNTIIFKKISGRRSFPPGCPGSGPISTSGLHFRHTRSPISKGDFRRPLPYKSRSVKCIRGSRTTISASSGCYRNTDVWFDDSMLPYHCPYSTNLWHEQDFGIDPNNRLIQKAWGQCYALLNKHKLAYGLELAQVRQTAGMIGSLMMDAANLLEFIRSTKKPTKRIIALFKRYKVDKQTLLKASRSGADRWLQLQFGVKPLLGTISDTVDRLTTKTQWDQLHVSASVKVKEKLNTSGSSHSAYSSKISTDHFVRMRLTARVTSPKLFTLSSYGLGPADVLSVLYDLVPFSFVVDWFLPINKWIKAYAVQQGLTVVPSHSYWTHFIKGAYETFQVQSVPYVNAYCLGYLTLMERRVISSFSMPSLSMKDDYLNAWTVATSAALIRQKLKLGA